MSLQQETLVGDLRPDLRCSDPMENKKTIAGRVSTNATRRRDNLVAQVERAAGALQFSKHIIPSGPERFKVSTQ